MVNNNDQKVFEIDVADSRFEKIYENPDFTIDPTDPKFDKEANEKFLNEKRKRKIQKK